MTETLGNITPVRETHPAITAIIEEYMSNGNRLQITTDRKVAGDLQV
jgi:hypothetical protein